MDKKKNLEKTIDDASFFGVENEIHIAPIIPSRHLPMRITRFGVTNPDPNYHVKRQASTAYVIEYISSGCGFLKINGKKYKLTAGDAYIIHIGDKCDYYSDKSNPYKKYWINFVPNYFFTDMLKSYDLNERVFKGLDLSRRFEKIMELQSVSMFSEDIYLPASRIIFDIIMDMVEYGERKSTNQHDDFAALIQLKLNQSITKSITIADIANELYRSTNDVIYRFKKKYGITPYAYLIDRRINTAKELLTNTNTSVKEIADYLCFFSEYHFSNTFKKKVGVSPSEFKRR